MGPSSTYCLCSRLKVIWREDLFRPRFTSASPNAEHTSWDGSSIVLNNLSLPSYSSSLLCSFGIFESVLRSARNISKNLINCYCWPSQYLAFLFGLRRMSFNDTSWQAQGNSVSLRLHFAFIRAQNGLWPDKLKRHFLPGTRLFSCWRRMYWHPSQLTERKTTRLNSPQIYFNLTKHLKRWEVSYELINWEKSLSFLSSTGWSLGRT